MKNANPALEAHIFCSFRMGLDSPLLFASKPLNFLGKFYIFPDHIGLEGSGDLIRKEGNLSVKRRQQHRWRVV